MYPEGTSPVGALDMAGTVWEWCLNSFQDPENCEYPVRQEDRRVLRGGSWVVSQLVCRAACRDGNGPSSRDVNIGFRLCLSSPIVDG